MPRHKTLQSINFPLLAMYTQYIFSIIIKEKLHVFQVLAAQFNAGTTWLMFAEATHAQLQPRE